MKLKEDVYQTLKEILHYYEANRKILKLNEEKATKRVLDVYSDFYEWIYELQDENTTEK